MNRLRKRKARSVNGNDTGSRFVPKRDPLPPKNPAFSPQNRLFGAQRSSRLVLVSTPRFAAPNRGPRNWPSALAKRNKPFSLTFRRPSPRRDAPGTDLRWRRDFQPHRAFLESTAVTDISPGTLSDGSGGRFFAHHRRALPLNTETNFPQWSAGLSRPPVTKWKALLSGVSLPLSDA